VKSIGNVIIMIVFFLFLINQFISNYTITILYTFLTLLIILFSIIFSNKLSQLFGFFMLIISFSILLYKQASLGFWIEGITENLPLICLIVIVPVLGIPISLGNYNEHLSNMILRFQNNLGALYLMVAGLFELIAPITNMGSIYIIHTVLNKTNIPSNFLGRVYIRSITSVHTWSPYFVSVFLVVYSLHIPIHSYLPYGILLSFFQVTIAFILFSYIEKQNIKMEIYKKTKYQNNVKIIELFLVIFLLTGFIFIFEPFTSINISILVSLIVLVFSLLWSIYLNMLTPFFKQVKKYANSILHNRADEVNLLLNAGLFGVILSSTRFSQYINVIWEYLVNISVFFLILGIIIVVAMLAFIGVHQIVTVSTIVATVSFTDLGISSIVMAMTLLSAWSIAVIISPISPANIIVSNLLKENPFSVILSNLVYALLLIFFQTLIIYSLHFVI